MLALCECLDRFCNIASRRRTSLGPPGAADGKFRRPVCECWVNKMDYAHPRAEYRCHYAKKFPQYRRPIALWLWRLPLGDGLGGSRTKPARLTSTTFQAAAPELPPCHRADWKSALPGVLYRIHLSLITTKSSTTRQWWQMDSASLPGMGQQ